MKFCERCSTEIATPDGENLCPECEGLTSKKRLSAAKAKAQRQARADAMRSLGLVKVRGALGGTYWE